MFKWHLELRVEGLRLRNLGFRELRAERDQDFFVEQKDPGDRVDCI